MEVINITYNREIICIDILSSWRIAVDYMRVVPGREDEKDSRNTRAYLNFKSVKYMVKFVKSFNGWKFMKKTGNYLLPLCLVDL